MAELRNLSRVIGMRGAKGDIESFDGALEEQAISYATDTGEIGIYTNGAWVWIGVGTGQYRQYVWADDGAGSWAFVTADGKPVFVLQDLE